MSAGILIISCGGHRRDPKADLLVESLRRRGVAVRELALENNHRLILDLLEQGERPCVLKHNL